MNKYEGEDAFDVIAIFLANLLESRTSSKRLWSPVGTSSCVVREMMMCWIQLEAGKGRRFESI